MAPLSTLSLVEPHYDRRISTDRTMSYLAYLLWVLVLGLLTAFIGGHRATIYQMVIGFQLLNRRNDHFGRQHQMFEQVIQGVRESGSSNAQVEGEIPAASSTLDDMRKEEGRREPWLWIVVWPILTLGIASLWTLYWLTLDWRAHAERQRQLTDQLSTVFRSLGYSSPDIIDSGVTPQRNYWLFLILSIVTLGLFAIYWAISYLRTATIISKATRPRKTNRSAP